MNFKEADTPFFSSNLGCREEIGIRGRNVQIHLTKLTASSVCCLFMARHQAEPECAV